MMNKHRMYVYFYLFHTHVQNEKKNHVKKFNLNMQQTFQRISELMSFERF